jgi:hypothetical protein
MVQSAGLTGIVEPSGPDPDELPDDDELLPPDDELLLVPLLLLLLDEAAAASSPSSSSALGVAPSPHAASANVTRPATKKDVRACMIHLMKE